MNSIELFYFISEFNKSEILTINKKINIIYRNYKTPPNEDTIKKILHTCKKVGRKLFLSNNLPLALKMKLDGIYIPSFNKSIEFKKKLNKNFRVLGSAHNLSEIRNKEKQGVDTIFLAPVFKTQKKTANLGINKFNLLAKLTNKKIIALGGINKNNIKSIKLVNCEGYAGITYFKNKEKIYDFRK
jgi:thiamine-phosphate pyrophosphorylase